MKHSEVVTGNNILWRLNSLGAENKVQGETGSELE